MKNTIRALAVAASSAAMIGSGLTAQAAPSTSTTATAASQAAATTGASQVLAAWDCPSDRLCVWDGANGMGARAVFRYEDSNLADNLGPRGMNDRITSFRNRTGRTWRFHDGINYHGATRYAFTGSQGNIGLEMSNRASSIKKLAY